MKKRELTPDTFNDILLQIAKELMKELSEEKLDWCLDKIELKNSKENEFREILQETLFMKECETNIFINKYFEK